MRTVERYGRIQIVAPEGAQWLEVAAPDGSRERVPAFAAQDYDFVYDRHGYEEQVARGGVYHAVRYTPELDDIMVPIAGAGAEAYWLCGDDGELEGDGRDGWWLGGFRRGCILKIALGK